MSLQYTYCIHNTFKYTKRSEVNPQKTKHMKMVQTFSLLWDSPRSHKRERLRLLWKYGIVYPFHTSLQQDAATNPPIQARKKKNCHFCPKQMLTKLNNKCVKATLQTNLIQCFQCILVSVKLFLCMPCRHSEEWRFSSTHWTGGWVGTKTVMGIWSTEKSLPLPGIKLWCLSCQTCGLLNISTMLSQLYLIPASMKKL